MDKPHDHRLHRAACLYIVHHNQTRGKLAIMLSPLTRQRASDARYLKNVTEGDEGWQREVVLPILSLSFIHLAVQGHTKWKEDGARKC